MGSSWQKLLVCNTQGSVLPQHTICLSFFWKSADTCGRRADVLRGHMAIEFLCRP